MCLNCTFTCEDAYVFSQCMLLFFAFVCVRVPVRPLPTPTAFSYSPTVIGCSAEIEPIYASQHQKQTNDC